MHSRCVSYCASVFFIVFRKDFFLTYLITLFDWQIAILDLLAEIMRELSTMMMAQQSKAFVTFIQTMLSRYGSLGYGR